MKTILVVDDEENICRLISKIFKNDYHIIMLQSGEKALEKIKSESVDVVLLDQNMPVLSGIDTLQMIKEYDKNIPVIMITAYARIELSVKSIKLGANDYIEKPFDTGKLKLAVLRALEIRYLNKEVEQLRSELIEKYSFQNIIGKSQLMKDMYQLIHNVSTTDISVLILGESGTGKELAARAIHYSSNHKKSPFVPINCAAIPDQLLESELFGYEKGAFSGAMNMKKGKIEMADGGTLFLDEIGDMAERTQAKLLRFLQDGKFVRVGGVDTIQVNVRIISATNKNLEERMLNHDFREDLYYRINGVQIELPSLSSRREDIHLLVTHFIDEFNSQYKLNKKGVAPDAMQILLDYSWPGNVRELKNAIQSAMILSTEDMVNSDNLPKKIKNNGWAVSKKTNNNEMAFNDQIEELEKELICVALEKTNNNRTQASKLLKISLRNLQYKIKKHDIDISG